MSDFRTVARVDEVPDGSLKSVQIEGTSIVLANSGGRIYALQDRCSHEEYPLSAGELSNGEVTCVLHGARFDLATGAPRALPAVRPVRTYEVRVEDGEIQVRAS